MNECDFLYHFTAKRFLKGIKTQGLRKGKLLKSMNPVSFLEDNYQWLTKNSDFEQSWACGTGALPYKRNEIRLKIQISKEMKNNLLPWSRARFLVPNVARCLESYGDPENWFVFKGIIWPKYILDITYNETNKPK